MGLFTARAHFRISVHILQKCFLLLATHTFPFVCIVLLRYSNQFNPVITPVQTVLLWAILQELKLGDGYRMVQGQYRQIKR